jgi:hypothetical protein
VDRWSFPFRISLFAAFALLNLAFRRAR